MAASRLGLLGRNGRNAFAQNSTLTALGTGLYPSLQPAGSARSALQLPVLVSVIIPSWNPGPALHAAVRSALEQTWRELEVIVFDDGSTDGSLDGLVAIEDPRLRIFRGEHAGSGAAKNRGVEESRGTWLKFLDADDLLAPDAIRQHMLAAERHGPRVPNFGSLLHFMEGSSPEDGRLQEARVPAGCSAPMDFLFDSLGANGDRHVVSTTQWFLSRELFEDAGGWDNDVLQMQDVEFSVRMLRLADGIEACPGSIACYRRYPTPRSMGHRRNAATLRNRFLTIGSVLDQLRAQGPDPRIDAVAIWHYRLLLARSWAVARDVARDCLAEIEKRGASPVPLPGLDRFDRRWETLFGWRSMLQTRFVRRRLRHWNPLARRAPHAVSRSVSMAEVS